MKSDRNVMKTNFGQPPPPLPPKQRFKCSQLNKNMFISIVPYLMYFSLQSLISYLKAVTPLCMATTVHRAPQTVKITYVIDSMEHVLHANLAGLGCFAIKV